jgi:hypothetical protein
MNSLAALALALVVCGCGRSALDQPVSVANATGGVGGGAGGTGGESGAAGANIRVPAQHRATSVCPAPPAAGDPRCQHGSNPVVSGLCNSDGDCDAQRKGRCEIRPPSGSCACVYDTCQSDADCSSGAACACNPVQFGNACVGGGCRVDQDCGVGGFCGPVVNPCSPAIVEYQCHSSRDQCASSSDCPPTDDCLAYPGEGWACRLPAVCR